MGTGNGVMRVATRCHTTDEFVAAFSSLVDEDTIVVMSDKMRPVGSRRRFAFELSDGSPVLRGEAEIVDATGSPRARIRLRLLLLDEPSRDVHERMLAHAGGRAPRETARRPVVRIPDPNAAAGKLRTARGSRGLAPIPAVPPRVIPTAAMSADELVTERTEPLAPPEPEPVVVPELAAPPEAPPPPDDQPRGTTRMFGLAPPMRTPPAFMITARPPPEPANTSLDAPGEVEPLQTIRMEPLALPEEERAAGSPFVLPANPLGELSDDALAAMVECRLFDDASAADPELPLAPPRVTASAPAATHTSRIDAAFQPRWILFAAAVAAVLLMAIVSAVVR